MCWWRFCSVSRSWMNSTAPDPPSASAHFAGWSAAFPPHEPRRFSAAAAALAGLALRDRALCFFPTAGGAGCVAGAAAVQNRPVFFRLCDSGGLAHLSESVGCRLVWAGGPRWLQLYSRSREQRRLFSAVPAFAPDFSFY